MARRDRGEGTIFQRSDGRWCAKINITLPNGGVKRMAIVRKDQAAVRTQLKDWKERNKKNLIVTEDKWTVESYMNHWLENIMPDKIRLSSLISYKRILTNYIIPSIGKIPLQNLGVRHVQTAIDSLFQRGVGVPTIQKFKQVLSSCLTRAMREEIVFRNVAQLVELPKYSPKDITPWTVEQSKLFLRGTRGTSYHIAYHMMLTYGIRKGEMHGLRWSDIDFTNDRIHIRQQIIRLAGELHVEDVKTKAGRRQLLLVPEIKHQLLAKARKRGFVIPPFDPVGQLSMDHLILISTNNRPVEPRNLRRSFHLYSAKLGLPRISMHTLRHTAATMLKSTGAPIKDVQLILGHANISTTLAIYQHGDDNSHRSSLLAIGSTLNEF